MIWWMKMNKVQWKLETELDNLQEAEVKDFKDNFLNLKLKERKRRINSPKFGELKTREVKVIDSLGQRCLSIYLVVKLVKDHVIEDDISYFYSHNFIILQMSYNCLNKNNSNFKFLWINN